VPCSAFEQASATKRVQPNHSLKGRSNGGPPGPEPRYGVHFLFSGPGVPPSASPLAQTLGCTKVACSLRIGFPTIVSVQVWRISVARRCKDVAVGGKAKQPDSQTAKYFSLLVAVLINAHCVLPSSRRRPRSACSLTIRSRGGPTAGHQAPSPGTVYIFCSRGLASHRRPPP
jgi:hypothetical protein